MLETRRSRGLAIRALLLLSMVISSAAQQVPATQPAPTPPPPASAPQPPVASPASTTPPTKITAGTQEVVVDLVVRDKHGNLVKDLTPADMEITDAGLPVKINSLRLIAGGQAKETDVTEGARAVRLVSLVFEHYGADAGQLARETADEILKADTAATLFFSVMQVDRRLRLVQYFTIDRTLLRNAVDSACLGARSRYRSDVEAAEKNVTSMNGGDNQRLAVGDTTGVSVTDMTMASMMIKALQDSEQTSRDTQSRPTLGALQALSQQLGTLPGRKTVVYFSEGLPLTAVGKQQLLATINAANRSNVGIYVIDVTGLSMASRAEAGRQMLAAAAQAGANNVGPSNSGSTAGLGIPGGVSPVSMTPAGLVTSAQVKAGDRIEDINTSDSQGSLIELAKSTGGSYVGDSNDLRKQARHLIEDLAIYYEATFQPENPKYDGSFHPLAVKLQRKGLTVQARNGYLALPPGTPPDVQPFEVGLVKSLSETELPKQLDFHTDVIRFGKEASGVTASMVVELPLSQLEFREDGNSKTFEVHPRILVMLRNESGQVVKRFSQDLAYHGASQAMAHMRDGVYTFQRSFTAPPGTYILEAAITDGLGEKTGAVRSTIKIAAPSGGADVSAISLVQRYESLNEKDTQEPFRYQNSRVVPSLQKLIVKEKTPTVATFFVIYPDPKLTEKPKLELEVSRRGELLGRIPMDLPNTTAPGPIPYIASLPSASLPPGPYELSAIVTQGGQTVEQKTAFTIDGPEPAPAPVTARAAAPSGNVGDGADIPEPAATNPAGTYVSEKTSIVITRVENAARPPEAEQSRIIEIARQRALDYQDTLPNFTCLQVTRRLVDASGKKNWRVKDNITELLRYSDKQEVRQTLEVDGVKVQGPRLKLGGVLSSGELGGLLNAVFDPKAKATFAWKDLANLGNQTCHVYSFHVDRPNSSYSLEAGTHAQNARVVAFHGMIYIDANSYAIRRISIEAENVPATFPVQESSIMVDYDVVAVGAHDYMLPVSAEMLVRMGKRSLVRNEINFRDYRRFGAESSIKFN
jgi:VWFA-related protein